MRSSPLSPLGLDLPVLAAPMAGGPTTPALVEAAARAGGLGFLAAGYRTPEQLSEALTTVRAADIPFGVNIFAPNPLPVDPAAYRRYATAIQPEAEPYGLHLGGGGPVEDDDHWQAKLDLLIADPVPLVSFTFAVPEPRVTAALRRVGTIVAQTVTSIDEARLAAEAGAEVLIIQGSSAGGHSGTLSPERVTPSVPLHRLLDSIRDDVGLPMIAAGGLATPEDVAVVLGHGAVAAMVGTVLLRTEESGASSTYRSAVADAPAGRTVVTRAFTGRPARALRNRFVDRYGDVAPSGYPAVHHLTSPLRRAAAAAGDTEAINLWAGTGSAHALDEPAAQTLQRLAGRL